VYTDTNSSVYHCLLQNSFWWRAVLKSDAISNLLTKPYVHFLSDTCCHWHSSDPTWLSAGHAFLHKACTDPFQTPLRNLCMTKTMINIVSAVEERTKSLELLYTSTRRWILMSNASLDFKHTTATCTLTRTSNVLRQYLSISQTNSINKCRHTNSSTGQMPFSTHYSATNTHLKR